MTAQLAKYTIVKNLTLILVKGSVVHFAGTTDKSAIVNAANAGALGGGGVDGAISAAGGHRLYEDRVKLPVLERRGDYEIRCHVGSAVMTGPGDYGELRVPYVIHAVGPNYNGFDEEEYDQAHELLKSAYSTSLDVASENRIEEVAFSLLSAGIFRGYCSLAEVLGLGVQSIVSWGKAMPEDSSLTEIYIVAFTARECATLKKLCDKAFGVESKEEDDGGDDKEMEIPAAKSEATSDTAMVVEDEDENEKETEGPSNKESMTLDAPEKEAPKEEKPSEQPSDESKNDKTKTAAVATSTGEKAITDEMLSDQPSDEDDKAETPVVATSSGEKTNTDASDEQLKEKSDKNGTTEAHASTTCPGGKAKTDVSDEQSKEKSNGAVKADTVATPSSSAGTGEKTAESNEDEKAPVDEKVESPDLAEDAHMSKEFEHRDAPDFAATIKNSGMKPY